MGTVTAKKPAKQGEREKGRKGESPASAPLGEFGNYRCTSDHPAFRGRPCNKRLGSGNGPFEGWCPRCRQVKTFAGPNDPIR